MNLSDRALLVQLSISQWTARKLDKRATKEVTHRNSASDAAGRFNKALLPMNSLLDDVHKKSTAVRTAYYENTLPWGIDGAQILPTNNYLHFMTEFRQMKSEWQSLVDRFLNNYEYMVRDAARLLGNLYDANDYPPVEELRNKFKMDMAVYPVTTSDFRVSIASDELTRIQQDVERRVQEASQNAMQEAWSRLHTRVVNIVEKLSDPKAIFRDSLIENAREICALLPRLNLNDDPHLETMRQQVEASLLVHPEILRTNPAVRQDTAVEAKKIMDAMSVFMGAN
jgi:hypothetical protein